MEFEYCELKASICALRISKFEIPHSKCALYSLAACCKLTADNFLLLIACCYVIQYTPLLLTEKVSSLMHASLSFFSLTRLIKLPLQVKWCLPQTFLAFLIKGIHGTS